MISTAWLMVVSVTLIGSIAAGTAIHHHGYIVGQAERTAYYAPLLKAAADAKSAADARVAAQLTEAQRITVELEAHHGQIEQALTDRANAAELRITELLRERATADTATGGDSVSSLPGVTTTSQGAASGDERDREFAASVSSVGHKCEHDADELAEFQRWYARQSANADAHQPFRPLK